MTCSSGEPRGNSGGGTHRHREVDWRLSNAVSLWDSLLGIRILMADHGGHTHPLCPRGSQLLQLRRQPRPHVMALLRRYTRHTHPSLNLGFHYHRLRRRRRYQPRGLGHPHRIHPRRRRRSWLDRQWCHLVYFSHIFPTEISTRDSGLYPPFINSKFKGHRVHRLLHHPRRRRQQRVLRRRGKVRPPEPAHLVSRQDPHSPSIVVPHDSCCWVTMFDGWCYIPRTIIKVNLLCQVFFFLKKRSS